MHVCSSVIETIYIFENIVSAKELAQTTTVTRRISQHKKNRGRRDLHIGILVHGALNDLIFAYSTSTDLPDENECT